MLENNTDDCHRAADMYNAVTIRSGRPACLNVLYGKKMRYLISWLAENSCISRPCGVGCETLIHLFQPGFLFGLASQCSVLLRMVADVDDGIYNTICVRIH